MSQYQSPELSVDVHKQLLAGLDIFHPSRLATDDSISVAVDVLEGSLDDKSIGPIILCSLQPEHPYVLEFIMSCKFMAIRSALNDRWRPPQPSTKKVIKSSRNIFSIGFLLILVDFGPLLVIRSSLDFRSLSLAFRIILTKSLNALMTIDAISK